MMDELEDLKRAFDAATPEPKADKRKAHIALAQKNFAQLQGTQSDTRLTFEGGMMRRFKTGVRRMYMTGPAKGGLFATTSLVAMIGVGFYWQDLRPPADLIGFAPEQEASSLEGAFDDGALFRPVIVQDTDEPRISPEPAPAIAANDQLSAQSGADRSDEELAQLFSEQRQRATVLAPAQKKETTVPDTFSGLDTRNQLRLGNVLNGASVEPPVANPLPNTETFANEAASPLQVTSEAPVSTFSIDVDTASYALMRSSLMAGQRPSKEAVRVEELVNYFTYAYPAPAASHPFEPTVTVVPSPWNAGTQLVHIGIQGTPPALEDRKPVNLVFLVDTSGSMNAPDKLPLLQQSLRLMLPELNGEDEIAIVAYAGRAGQVLAPTPASEKATISAALSRLMSGGSTAGAAGLREAYATAETMAQDGEITRVILATDGDFNVGVSNPDALKDLIAEKRQSGIYLSVLGFGRGNLQDATMQALAQNGNGTAAFIDSLREAQKVLVSQLAASLEPIADDVKIQVEFNPARVAEYRLIGYETRSLRREDFNNDKVDAGDIGAGHQVTAIYEVTPVGSPAIRNTPLRYQTANSDLVSDELGYLKLRYKMPGAETSTLIERPIVSHTASPGSDIRFSIAIAGFGELLRGGHYQEGWNLADARRLAEANRGPDLSGLRAEAVMLIRLAESLAQ